MNEEPVSGQIRLGAGEYNDGGYEPRYRARMLFLEALERRVPGAIAELRRDVLPLHEEVFDLPNPDKPLELDGDEQELAAAFAQRPPLVDAQLNQIFTELALFGEDSWRIHRCLRFRAGKTCLDMRRVRDGVVAWARRWHLDRGWVVEAVLDQLAVWRSTAAAAAPGWGATRAIRQRELVSAEEREFAFADSGWRPAYQWHQDYKRQLRRRFDRELDDYLKRMDAVAARVGKRTPTKQAPEHFDWLVDYQVLGLSYSRIAKREYRGRKTVEEGVKSAAGLIGLPLRRASPPGRPRTRAS